MALLQPFFSGSFLNASGALFQDPCCMWEPFCKAQGGPFAGPSGGWLRTQVFFEWGPSSVSHHFDSSWPSMACHKCSTSQSSLLQCSVSSSRSIPVAVVALDVAPILLQSWPVDVADPVLLQAIQDIQLHNLSCHSEPFCRAPALSQDPIAGLQ